MTIIVQSYGILLSVLFCVNRQQLSLFDANHAIMLVSSPLMLHVLYICIVGLFKTRYDTGAFPRVICAIGAPLLPILTVLKLTLSLSSRAFIDSELCSNRTSVKEPGLPHSMYFTSSCYILGILSNMMSPQCFWIWELAWRVVKCFRAQEGTPEPQEDVHTQGDRVHCGRTIQGTFLVILSA